MPLNSFEPNIILVRSNRSLASSTLSHVPSTIPHSFVVTVFLRSAPLSSSRSIKAPCDRENRLLFALSVFFALPARFALHVLSALLAMSEKKVGMQLSKEMREQADEKDEGIKQMRDPSR